MAARVYTDKDSHRKWLQGKRARLSVLQRRGRAHALNLRDSGSNAGPPECAPDFGNGKRGELTIGLKIIDKQCKRE
jgi:hypothetical protein